MFQICFRSHVSNVDAGHGCNCIRAIEFAKDASGQHWWLKVVAVIPTRQPCFRSAVSPIFQMVFQMMFQMVFQVPETRPVSGT